MWILSSREKVLDIWCEVFMESFRAYLKQTKIFFIACVFMAAVSTAVICLYQLPLEARSIWQFCGWEQELPFFYTVMPVTDRRCRT